MAHYSKHALSKDFFNFILKDPAIQAFLKYISKDNTINIELRGNENCISFYYRGAKLFDLKYFANLNEAELYINNGYMKSNQEIAQIINSNLQKMVIDKSKFSQLIFIIPLLKQLVDNYLTNIVDQNNNGKQKLEQDAQQAVVRENNYSKINTSTDYFCLDTEFSYDQARFDIIGIEWPSVSSARTKRNKCKLTLFEAKYWCDAIDGKSGVMEHITDYINLMNDKKAINEIIQDMETIIKQKCALGLFDGCDCFANVNHVYIKSLNENTSCESHEQDITINREYPIEFVFLFVNYDPTSKRLYNELKSVFNKFKSIELKNIYIASASELGYGLYRYNKDKTDRFIPLETYYQKLEGVFSKP